MSYEPYYRVLGDIDIRHITLNTISGCQSNRSCSNNSNARDNETDGEGQRRNWKGISNKSQRHSLLLISYESNDLFLNLSL